MAHQFSKIMFTDAIKNLQERYGSRRQYERMAQSGPNNDRLGPNEVEFIAQRDSFYIASEGENGWPYMQHRGGPKGFLTVIDGRTVTFADFSGNKQYISAGNVTRNDKVSLFLMDYPHQTRLKILGHAEIIDPKANPVLANAVGLPGYAAQVERIFRIRVAAFEWNCPQHITPRFTHEELQESMEPLLRQLSELKLENERLRLDMKAPK
jgi:predicted pyridoxine 5'-phosphate oxidase superfamily flavin-nucleotide-binding protein